MPTEGDGLAVSRGVSSLTVAGLVLAAVAGCHAPTPSISCVGPADCPDGDVCCGNISIDVGGTCFAGAACPSRESQNMQLCGDSIGTNGGCPPDQTCVAGFPGQSFGWCAQSCTGNENDCPYGTCCGAIDQIAGICAFSDVCPAGQTQLCGDGIGTSGGCPADQICGAGISSQIGRCVCAGNNCPEVDGGRSLDGGLDARSDASEDGATARDGGNSTDGGLDAASCDSCVAPCSLASDTHNCGACGHDCLGGACVGGSCQPVKLTGTAQPISLILDGTTLYWTVNEAAADGGTNGMILSMATTGGLSSTVNIGSGHTYGAIGASATNLYFGDQTAGGVLSIQKQVAGGAPTVLVQNVIPGSIAVQESTASPTGGVVYFGNSGSVNWVTLPVAGGLNDSMDLPSSQVAIDGKNVYAVGPRAAGACPLGTSCTDLYTMVANGLTQGQGIFSDGTNVWISDQGATSATGSIYKCPTSGCSGYPPTPFVSGQNHPFAVVADANYVYWTESYAGGPIMRCNVSGCGKSPTAIGYAAGTPTALVQDTIALYWAETSQISKLAK